MRSRGVATLLAGVLIAAATPTDLGSALRDSPACGDWNRAYQVACVAPLLKLGRRDDSAAWDARRRLCEGCRAILEHAACPSQAEEAGPRGCGRDGPRS